MQWRRIRERTAGAISVDVGNLVHRRKELYQAMRLRRQVPLLQCEGSGTPFLTGIIKPRIVFPQDVLARASEEELNAALAHELAHVKRRDLLWNWLAAVVETLFFFHPLLWLARREWKLSQGIRSRRAGGFVGTN